MKHPLSRRAVLAALLCCFALPTTLPAAPPDLTASGVMVDTTYTYNLGPTGARGWIYSTGNEWLFTPEGLTTESRQILVTQIDSASPAAGILQVNDVILGASGTAATPVNFTSDARKSLGLAVGDAERSENSGTLKLKIWRGGVTSTVQLTLAVMGTYSATAPFSCPKSTNIIHKSCALLATHSINSGYTEGDAVIGLALLACVSPGDSYYATVQSKLQTYARSLASQNLSLTIPVNAMVAWPWGYSNVFLSEYYLATGDAQVLPAIRELTATCATGQSLFGTYGHGMAWSKSDGSSTHGYVAPYGPVNQAGETVNLGIMLGRRALSVAGDATIDPEIEPAITRARNYFGYFAGKGAVPYGHSPPEDLHDDNGKSGLASLLMALQTQADMSAQAQYFAKSCTAAYNLREMGHCGPYWAHLWQPLGANVGGPTAMSAYFKQIQWELDMVRRWDGSFAYHSATGATADATGLGTDSDTACFLLTFGTALQRIYLTGKSQSSANFISSADVTEAITDGVYSLHTDLTTLTSDQLVAALGSWSPQKRNWAAAELATRSDASTKVPTLLTMAADLTNLNARKGACQALGQIKDTRALTVLNARLTDSDYHVRYYAANALGNMGSAASPVLTSMLNTIVSTAQPVEPINWADPFQIAYSTLGSAVFQGQLGGSVSGVSTSLLYPAITSLSTSLGRASLMDTFNNALSAADVQALAPVITTAILTDHTICQGGLSTSCVNLLAKYNVDEGIPAAMTFLNQEYGRAWPVDSNTCLNALQKYGSAAAATLNTLNYWNVNGYDLAATIAAIQNDTTTHTLLNFKSINSCSATPTTVALPLGTTLLGAAAADIDGNSSSLVYTWSKRRGAGAVTFSVNGTTTSNNTLATFDTPGTYLVRLGVTDSALDPNKYGPVTRDLTIIVTPDPNQPPVAANQNVVTALNTAKTITLTATDANADTLTYSIVTGPASGSLSGTPPNLTYTPVAGFSGNTSFTFKANDGKTDSSIATVTIAVGVSGNTTPVAQNQCVSTSENAAKAITLGGSDADSGTTLTYSISTPPAHGLLTGTAPNLIYTPALNYHGSDSFTYTSNDGTATSAPATVVILVAWVNQAPVAVGQSLSTPVDTPIPVTLVGTDPEGYAVTYTLTSLPSHGALTGTIPNFTYTPASLYHGADSLAFTVTDSEGVVSSLATVSITVTPVNHAPVALNRSLPVVKNGAASFVLDGTDVDADSLTYTVLSQPTHGTLSGTAPNLTYTPVTGYDSIDSFTFKVNDGKLDSNTATVSFSMGTTAAGVWSEFYQWPGGAPSPWPDVSSRTPDATRVDSVLSISIPNWPTYFDDHFSSRHTGYINVSTAGNYTFGISADDNTKLWIDETLVIEQYFPNYGTSPALHLTTGYHSVRLEFVETYGDNYFTLYWSGPGFGNQMVPASVLSHCVGSTAPLSPRNLTATPLDSRVALAWAASPFATSYTVSRSLTPGGPYSPFSPVTTSNYLDTAVADGTTYYYVVTATGSGGTSYNSAEASATPVAAPVTLNLDYHPGGSYLMNGSTSYSVADSGTASRVAPLDYNGINASAVAVNFWNAGADGTAALTSMRNSQGVATTIGVSALLISHGSANDWGGLGVAPNGAKLLKGGLQLSQSPSLLTYNTLFKLSGLNTAHRYALALASQYNTDDRSASFRVGTVQATADNGGNATDWNAGFNYALLDNLIPNSAGEIHVQAMVNTDWAPLNGWQLFDKGVRTGGANAYTTLDTCSFGALGSALISGSNISITVPYGTAIGALTPTLVAAAGATISPSGPQNFASPVTYRVTAENAVNYQDYTVTIAVAPNVSFTTTTLPVTSTALGAQILSTGALVAANHFGNGSDGLAADAPVTLDNGLTFGTSIAYLGSGWNGHATDSWASSASISNVPYKTLMSCVFWIAWDPSVTPITFPGLTPGHTYRLQMISVQPNNCLVSIGGGTPTTWSGDNTLLTATWAQPAARTDMDIVLSRGAGQGEIKFNGYALHDVTSGFQPAPTGLTATAGDRQISLSWDSAPGATSYSVKRSLTTGGPYSSLGNATGTTYLDAALTNGIRYYYVVSATTALGDTQNSAQASALPVPPPAPPPAPTNLAATPGNNSVALSWSATSDATGFHVKRSQTSGGAYTTVGSPGSTNFTDLSVTNGLTYFYVVTATNGAGESPISSQISVVPAPVASATTLASAPNGSAAYGAAVTFTATVAVSSGTASGTVTFSDGATALGAGSLSGGVATYATSALAVGAHSIIATYGGDTTYAPSASAALGYTVAKLALTITGVTASDKVYDGSATATLAGGSVAGMVNGETVTVIPGSGAFASPNVGNRAVSASGYALGGSNAGNYSLSAQPLVPNANITPRPVQLAGARAYDATATAAAGILSIQNKVAGDDVSLTGNANLAAKEVGTQGLSTLAAAARVQVATANTGTVTTATSFIASLAAAPLNGNTLIAVISTRSTTQSRITGITQTGATWTRATQSGAGSTTGSTTEIWYAPNVSGAGMQVTINQATGVRSAAVVIEYSGVLTAGPLDAVANSFSAGTAGTTAATGSTATTAQPNELWLAGIGLVSSGYSLSAIQNSFTSVTTAQSTNTTATNNAKACALERFASTTGAASSSATITSSQWSGAIACFKTVTATSLALAGTAAGNYTLAGLSGSVTVAAKNLTVTGLAATNRSYDGTPGVALTGSATLQPSEAAGAGSGADGKPYAGDSVTVGGTPTASLADKNAGTAKPVTVTGCTLGGTQAGNYTLSQPAGLTASIAQRPLTVAAVAASKTYDGTTAAAGTPTLTPALAAGDTTSVLSQAFQNPGAGTGNKVVVPNITISDGNGGANYAITLTNFTTATITKAAAGIVLGGLARSYDGTPKAATATTVPPGLTVAFTYDSQSAAPGAQGSYAVVATVSDPNYAGTASGTLVIYAEPILAWRSNHFSADEIAAGLAADTLDADGDGLSNLAEFTLGTDPRGFSPPPLTVTPTALADHFTLSFLARRAAGVGYESRTRKYTVEATTNLANPTSWQPVTGYSNIVGDDQTVTLTLPATLPNQFYRLNVRLE